MSDSLGASRPELDWPDDNVVDVAGAAAGGGVADVGAPARTSAASTAPRAVANTGRGRPMALNATSGRCALRGAEAERPGGAPGTTTLGNGDPRTRPAPCRRNRWSSGAFRQGRPPPLPGGRIRARRH